MNQFGKTINRMLIAALVYCAAAVVARAEEPHSGNREQSNESRANSARLPDESSPTELTDIDATQFLVGETPRGTTHHDAPDGPAVIHHTSIQRRAFMKPLKLPKDLADQEGMAHVYINLFYLSHADFKLAGQVVDELMQPMRDVQMTVTAEELTDIWNGTRRTDVFRQHLTDGRFDIDLKAYIEVDVSFEKDGFRREIYEPQLAEPDPNEAKIDRLMQRERPKIREFTQDRLRIVMAKPKPTENLYCSVPTLVWRSDDRGVVADFGRIFGGQGLGCKVVNLHDADELPPGCLMFVPLRDEGGRVALQETSDKLMPAGVEFRVNDKNGGLQLLKPIGLRRRTRSM